MTDEELNKQGGEQGDGAARHLREWVGEADGAGAGVAAVTHRETERGRVRAPGRTIGDGRRGELVAVWEHDGSWTFVAPALGVTLSPSAALLIAEAIIERGDGQWCDACGVPIPEGCRVEQIAVATGHGALPARVPKRGQVTALGDGGVTVRFDGEAKVASVGPHLLRVLDAPGS